MTMDALDPFTETIIQRLAETLVAAREASQTQPLTDMCSEVWFMYDLIGNIGFSMMGAHHVQFDNDQFNLTWKMGSGASMDTVEFSYNPGKDLFNLRFRRYVMGQSIIIEKETEFLGIYDDMVIPLIDKQTGSRQTGFYLRL
ncbi:hypothetical protein [Spirosoma luteum]|uniref:hypothetical protein n=1 Tax=Spirosoma luteum TaxID=431553 RepID=UPI00039CFE88|nr:hypothetical protein [Spirosoma luteum]